MKENRKDCNPKETIKLIKKILKDNNIKIKEHKVKSLYNKFYSFRIELKNFYNMGSNGKGITKDFAKASAYAELMERLESRMLINTYYLNKTNTYKSYYDEIYDTKKVHNNKNLLKTFFEKDVDIDNFLSNNEKYNHVSNYKNLITEKNEYLPSKLINATTFSNGLCAGNNYYEAINQGICEIFERHAYREILTQEIKLNTIIIDDTLPIFENIKFLEYKNFNIEIKDCSLGLFPVVGVYITNLEKSKYIFTIGSDPNISVAIQRCLTEAFQGLKNEEELFTKMKPLQNNYQSLSIYDKKLNWLKNYSSNNGIHPTNIFRSPKQIFYKNLKCFSTLKTNPEIYKFLLNIINKNNLSIYIKDFSFLGFNTYKIFIPTLSTIEKINNNEKDMIKNFDLIKEIYFNLKDYNNIENLQKASGIVSKILNNNKYAYINLGNYFHANMYLKTKYNDITFELFYILINYKLKRDIDISIIKNENLKEYIRSIKADDKFTYIVRDLKLKLPQCQNCNTCKLKNKCKYNSWKQLNNILKSKEKM